MATIIQKRNLPKWSKQISEKRINQLKYIDNVVNSEMQTKLIKDLTIYSILELYRLKFKCLRFLSNILSTT